MVSGYTCRYGLLGSVDGRTLCRNEKLLPAGGREGRVVAVMITVVMYLHTCTYAFVILTGSYIFSLEKLGIDC